MAKLVTKFKYLKPGDRSGFGGYIKYIATREGVEKIDDTKKLLPATKKQRTLIKQILNDFPDAKEMLEYEDYEKDRTIGNASEFISRALEEKSDEITERKTYADYIATRPGAERFGSHGLFTTDGVHVDLKKVSEELDAYGGNVWTVIISLRRPDAERLGFHTGARWRDMLRTQEEALSRELNIPITNLKWFAAFHNESHHPHIHLIAYSTRKNEGYLTPKGVKNLRSSFARDIFMQDNLSVYEKQTEYRDRLRLSSREVIAEIIEKINTGGYDNPALEEKLLQLAQRLARTNGKKVYGYLKADVKAVVNSIVDELAADERISSLYDLWYEQKESVVRTYTEEVPERVPLSRNNEFKPVKNVVIEAAMNIVSENVMIESAEELMMPDGEMDDEDSLPASEGGALASWEDDVVSDERSNSYQRNGSWWTDRYKKARSFLYGEKDMHPDFEQAILFMQEEAETGNGFAMHDLGRMYLSGLGCEKDEATAQEWFAEAYRAFISEEQRAEKPGYLQYRIGKLYSFGYGVAQNHLKAAEWYQKAVGENNPFAAYALGCLYLRGQGVEKDEAKAYSLLRKAAEHERNPNAYAAYELGRMCRDGVGTDADHPASERWYRQAYEGFLKIEQNMADDKLYYRLGQMNLTGTGTEADVGQAKKYFEKAAELDNTDALFGLGKLYLEKDGGSYDAEKAVKYLLKAAEKDHEHAQYTLGKLYLRGADVRKDTEAGLIWLYKAVENENPYAEYLLGKTLLEGKETTQNTSEGYKLLHHAAEKGVIPALYLLGKLFYQGKVIPKDLKRALYFLETAAMKNNSYAAYLAGKILLTEDEVKDTEKAIRYFEQASQGGNDFAEYQLGKLYLFGTEVRRDEEKGITYLRLSAEHGNEYAKQLLHHFQSDRNWRSVISTFSLLQSVSRIVQDRIEDQRKLRRRQQSVDRKLRSRIEEKKQAHGLRI